MAANGIVLKKLMEGKSLSLDDSSQKKELKETRKIGKIH